MAGAASSEVDEARNTGRVKEGAPVEALFLIGAPRSGTSLLYKTLCLHPDAAWISNWVRKYPRVPLLAALNRVSSLAPGLRRRVWFGSDSNAYVYGGRRSLGERVFPMPVEGEPVFARSGIPDIDGGLPSLPRADQVRALRSAFAAIRRFGGGRLFVNKRIANNRRIPLLLEAFPAARFLEIVRDGRAVAYSLSRVDWWPDSVVWWNGTTPRQWAARGLDPWELCARSWVEEVHAIDEGMAAVPSGQRLTIAYEAFLEDPSAAFEAIAAFCGLGPHPRWRRHLSQLHFPNRNEAWRRRLDPSEVATIERIQADTLVRYGYAS